MFAYVFPFVAFWWLCWSATKWSVSGMSITPRGPMPGLAMASKIKPLKGDVWSMMSCQGEEILICSSYYIWCLYYHCVEIHSLPTPLCRCVWGILISICFFSPKFRHSAECCQPSISWAEISSRSPEPLVEPCKHHKEPIVPPQPSGSLARALVTLVMSEATGNGITWNDPATGYSTQEACNQNQQNGPIRAGFENYTAKRQLSENGTVWILHRHRWQILPRWRCDKEP